MSEKELALSELNSKIDALYEDIKVYYKKFYPDNPDQQALIMRLPPLPNPEQIGPHVSDLDLEDPYLEK